MTLSEYLSKKKLTPAQFAEAIGTSQASVSRYMNGRRFPRHEHLIAIAKATKGAVTANDFVRPINARAVSPTPEEGRAQA